MPYDAATWRTHCDRCGVVCHSDRDPKGPVAVSLDGYTGVVCYPCWERDQPPPPPRQAGFDF